MAEQEENSLIGYDPLAWLQESAEPEPTLPAAVELDDLLELAEPVVEPEPIEDPSVADIDETGQQDVPAANAPASRTIILAAVQTIQNVAQLQETLIQALDSSDKIEIDASAITQIDTASLQLLVILKQTAIKLQKEVVFDFPSDKFIEAASLLGLDTLLEVDQAAAGFF